MQGFVAAAAVTVAAGAGAVGLFARVHVILAVDESFTRRTFIRDGEVPLYVRRPLVVVFSAVAGARRLARHCRGA